MSFFTHFPSPKSLSIPAYGLEISDRSFKYAKFFNTQEGIKLEKFGGGKIPKDIIIGGEIKKKEDLISIFKAFFQNSNVKYVIVSLPEEKAFLSVVDLPLMENDEIGTSIEAQIEEYVPLDAQTALFDFEIIDNLKKKQSLDVAITAFPRSLVENYREVLVKSGLKPIIFEPEASALARVLLKENDSTTKMIIDFGKTRTSFIVVSNGKVLFTSTVKMAGEDLDKAISRSFSVDMKEAEKIKKKQGFIQTGEHSDVYSVTLPIISAIADEIKKYFSYWQTHYAHIHNKKDNQKIQEVILCGGDSNLKGLTEYLTYQLNLPVFRANVWVNINDINNTIPEINFEA